MNPPFATSSHKIFQWLMLSRAASIAGHYKSISNYYYQRRLSFRKPESRSVFMQIITPLFQVDEGFALLAQLFNFVRLKRLDHWSISTSGHLRHLLMNLHFRSADPLTAKHNTGSGHSRVTPKDVFIQWDCLFARAVVFISRSLLQSV